MPEITQEEKLDRDLKIIKEWLAKQPHLPNKIEDIFLKRFILSCRHSLERTKTTIDLCYTVRTQSPEIFKNRDPENPQIENIYRITDMVPLPKPTAENHKVFIYRLADFNADNFVFNDAVKAFLMLADVRLISEQEFHAGEIPIFDMAGLTLRHVSKIVFPTLKKYMIYTQEAHPIRLKQIHIINSTPFLDRVLSLVKPLMKSEVIAMMHTHLPNSDTLYKYVPQELLPEEYGGKAGKIADLKAEWMKRIKAHRDYFLDEERWLVDESKRPTPNTHKTIQSLNNMQGSFRSLAID